jgi:predicted porin
VAATGAAFAQSTVTLFGVADIGYNSKEWKTGAVKAEGSGIVDGALAGSRFGFRGTEDLGGGLKAEFVIEQAISPTSAGLTNARTASSGFQIDSGVTAVSGRSAGSLNRQTYVGLASGMGTVRVGYQYTNVYELSTLSGYMLAGEGVHGSDFAHTAGNGYVGGTRANAITYITPNISGFTGQLQYGAGTGLQEFTHNAPTSVANQGQFKAERTSLMVKYAAGPLSAAVAHTTYKNGTATDGTAAIANAVTGKLSQVGASYDFGMAKVGLTYNTGKGPNAIAAQARKVDAYSLTAAIPFGATSLTVGYHDINEKDGAGAAVTKGSGMQVGVIHNLSKRTAAYVYYGQNDFDNATVNSGTTTATAVRLTNLKQTDFTVGVRHSF